MRAVLRCFFHVAGWSSTIFGKKKNAIIKNIGMKLVRLVAGLLLFAVWIAQEGQAQTQNITRVDYPSRFAKSLRETGEISVAEFSQRYQLPEKYLDQLTSDPTTAKYFDQFQVAQPQGKFGPTKDFRLNDAEQKLYEKNGFVVSERLGARTFAKLYFEIYSRDLPVMVTSDSILHAWHRSYDAMLAEIEETFLFPALNTLLDSMAAELPSVQPQDTTGDLSESVQEADFFLAVARSLLKQQLIPGQLSPQSSRIQAVLNDVRGLQLKELKFAGGNRNMDYSQFKPRGHYEKTETLRRYFQTMMWCGRTDLQVSKNKQQLSTAVVLFELLNAAKKMDEWRKFDAILRPFVGATDALTFAELEQFLSSAKYTDLAELQEPERLDQLQALLQQGNWGVQAIRSEVSRDAQERSFTVLGQRFVLDSWATGQVVYDKIVRENQPVMRRNPSALDVAFAVLQNDHVVPELARAIQRGTGRDFRDGLPYQHNLAALRKTLDEVPESVWQENLYLDWLGCLRTLSRPTTADHYPEAMRTQAWAMKLTNTQLASWTTLRHDTILYVKQSYTKQSDCSYPAGYVEPLPEFWARMEQMSLRAVKIVAQLPVYQAKRQKEHFETFAKHLKMIREISERELAKQPLNDEQILFLRNVVTKNDHGKPDTDSRGGQKPAFLGWYFDLFYAGRFDADEWDALVADVHSNPPDPLVGDPGSVLHQAVGDVDLLLITLEQGAERIVFAAPTLSHYEFSMPGLSRRSDSEWKRILESGATQLRPSWTTGHLVPR